MSLLRGLGVGVVFDGALAHTGARWGAGSLLVRWRTRPVSERWLLQEVCDFLDSHGWPKRTGERGEMVSGQDIFPRLEMCPPHHKTLPYLVELLEPPPACPFAGRSAQGSSAAFTPDPLVRPLPRPGWRGDDPGVPGVVTDGWGVSREPGSLSGDAGVW